jgi:hypothetical protein
MLPRRFAVTRLPSAVASCLCSTMWFVQKANLRAGSSPGSMIFTIMLDCCVPTSVRPLNSPQAIPILNDALAALDTIKEADIT